MGILLASWYPSLVAMQALVHEREPGERDYLVYTHAASCIADSTLWPDTCNDFYLTFQALVKICLSYRMILLTLKHKTL